MMLLAFLLAGVFAGLTAGMLGVGGGIVVVPVLILVFELQGFAPQVLTHMAIATSLAVIVFTSISSVWNHQRAGNVDRQLLRDLVYGVVPGVVLGVLLASVLDGQWLKRIFALFACYVALRMWFKASQPPPLARPLRGLPWFGAGIGAVSSLLGIGGGTLSVPLLQRAGVPMRRCIGTAAALGLPIALFGAVGNMLAGSQVAARPEWSLGYVYLPALLGISVCSVPCAKLGVKLSQKLPVKVLQQVFAVLLCAVGIRFLFA